MDAAFWQRISAEPRYLDGTRHPLEMTPAEVEQVYLPLARRILVLPRLPRRVVVAIAGPPGSGKSAFAAALALVLNALSAGTEAAVVGMDGWHYPNRYLEEHALRSQKGAPESYNFAALRDFLRRARRSTRLAYPIYSRETHDPMDGGLLETRHTIVLVEGNYLLLDEVPWRKLRHLYDLTIFLHAEAAALLPGLRERHLRGGKTEDFTTMHIQQVDLPNIRRVLEHSFAADVVVRKANSREMAGGLRVD